MSERFRLNADRIWASTPQIADYHGLRGLEDILYPDSLSPSGAAFV